MNHVVRVCLVGLLALLPLVITIVVTIWVASLAQTYLGPESHFGQLLIAIGLSVNAGAVVPYALGLAVVLVFVYLFGLLVETRIGGWVPLIIDGLLRRVPLLSNIYDMSQKFVSIVDTKSGDTLEGMSPVWCFFGGDRGAAVLALLPSMQPITIGSDDYLGILVPTAPVPFGGCLIYVPATWIKPADGGVEHLMNVYVSMGVTPPRQPGDGDKLPTS